MPFGQVACYQVWRRVEVGRDKHIQNPASAGAQPATRRAGIFIPILREKKHQRRNDKDYCGLNAPRYQTGLE